MYTDLLAIIDDLEPIDATPCQESLAGQCLYLDRVSEEVNMREPIMRPWCGFTRFDPDADLHPAGRPIRGNCCLLNSPILIDPRLKKGYPQPIEFKPAVQGRVNGYWSALGICLAGRPAFAYESV